MLRSMIKSMIYIYTVTLFVTVVCVSVSDAASTSIVKSKHDFSMSSTASPFAGQFQIGGPLDYGPLIEEICVFCHTPHGASRGNTDPVLNTMLWNRISSPPQGYTYKAYTSSSSTLIAPDTGDRRPTGISMMCMSCHDGVTSIAVNVGGNPSTPTLLNTPGPGNPQVSIDQFSSLAMPGAIGNIYNNGTLGWGANIGNARPNSGDTQIDLSNDHPISFVYPSPTAELRAPINTELRLFGNRMECATCHRVHNPSIEPFLAMSNAESLMCRSCHIK